MPKQLSASAAPSQPLKEKKKTRLNNAGKRGQFVGFSAFGDTNTFGTNASATHTPNQHNTTAPHHKHTPLPMYAGNNTLLIQLFKKMGKKKDCVTKSRALSDLRGYAFAPPSSPSSTQLSSQLSSTKADSVQSFCHLLYLFTTRLGYDNDRAVRRDCLKCVHAARTVVPKVWNALVSSSSSSQSALGMIYLLTNDPIREISNLAAQIWNHVINDKNTNDTEEHTHEQVLNRVTLVSNHLCEIISCGRSEKLLAVMDPTVIKRKPAAVATITPKPGKPTKHNNASTILYETERDREEGEERYERVLMGALGAMGDLVTQYLVEGSTSTSNVKDVVADATVLWKHIHSTYRSSFRLASYRLFGIVAHHAPSLLGLKHTTNNLSSLFQTCLHSEKHPSNMAPLLECLLIYLHQTHQHHIKKPNVQPPNEKQDPPPNAEHAVFSKLCKPLCKQFKRACYGAKAKGGSGESNWVDCFLPMLSLFSKSDEGYSMSLALLESLWIGRTAAVGPIDDIAISTAVAEGAAYLLRVVNKPNTNPTNSKVPSKDPTNNIGNNKKHARQTEFAKKIGTLFLATLARFLDDNDIRVEALINRGSNTSSPHEYVSCLAKQLSAFLKDDTQKDDCLFRTVANDWFWNGEKNHDTVGKTSSGSDETGGGDIADGRIGGVCGAIIGDAESNSQTPMARTNRMNKLSLLLSYLLHYRSSSSANTGNVDNITAEKDSSKGVAKVIMVIPTLQDLIQTLSFTHAIRGDTSGASDDEEFSRNGCYYLLLPALSKIFQQIIGSTTSTAATQHNGSNSGTTTGIDFANDANVHNYNNSDMVDVKTGGSISQPLQTTPTESEASILVLSVALCGAANLFHQNAFVTTPLTTECGMHNPKSDDNNTSAACSQIEGFILNHLLRYIILKNSTVRLDSTVERNNRTHELQLTMNPTNALVWMCFTLLRKCLDALPSSKRQTQLWETVLQELNASKVHLSVISMGLSLLSLPSLVPSKVVDETGAAGGSLTTTVVHCDLLESLATEVGDAAVNLKNAAEYNNDEEDNDSEYLLRYQADMSLFLRVCTGLTTLQELQPQNHSCPETIKPLVSSSTIQNWVTSCLSANIRNYCSDLDVKKTQNGASTSRFQQINNNTKSVTIEDTVLLPMLLDLVLVTTTAKKPILNAHHDVIQLVLEAWHQGGAAWTTCVNSFFNYEADGKEIVDNHNGDNDSMHTTIMMIRHRVLTDAVTIFRTETRQLSSSPLSSSMLLSEKDRTMISTINEKECNRWTQNISTLWAQKACRLLQVYSESLSLSTNTDGSNGGEDSSNIVSSFSRYATSFGSNTFNGKLFLRVLGMDDPLVWQEVSGFIDAVSTSTRSNSKGHNGGNSNNNNNTHLHNRGERKHRAFWMIYSLMQVFTILDDALLKDHGNAKEHDKTVCLFSAKNDPRDAELFMELLLCASVAGKQQKHHQNPLEFMVERMLVGDDAGLKNEAFLKLCCDKVIDSLSLLLKKCQRRVANRRNNTTSNKAVNESNSADNDDALFYRAKTMLNVLDFVMTKLVGEIHPSCLINNSNKNTPVKPISVLLNGADGDDEVNAEDVKVGDVLWYVTKGEDENNGSQRKDTRQRVSVQKIHTDDFPNLYFTISFQGEEGKEGNIVAVTSAKKERQTVSSRLKRHRYHPLTALSPSIEGSTSKVDNSMNSSKNWQNEERLMQVLMDKIVKPYSCMKADTDYKDNALNTPLSSSLSGDTVEESVELIGASALHLTISRCGLGLTPRGGGAGIGSMRYEAFQMLKGFEKHILDFVRSCSTTEDLSLSLDKSDGGNEIVRTTNEIISKIDEKRCELAMKYLSLAMGGNHVESHECDAHHDINQQQNHLNFDIIRFDPEASISALSELYESKTWINHLYHQERNLSFHLAALEWISVAVKTVGNISLIRLLAKTVNEIIGHCTIAAAAINRGENGNDATVVVDDLRVAQVIVGTLHQMHSIGSIVDRNSSFFSDHRMPHISDLVRFFAFSWKDDQCTIKDINHRHPLHSDDIICITNNKSDAWQSLFLRVLREPSNLTDLRLGVKKYCNEISRSLYSRSKRWFGFHFLQMLAKEGCCQLMADNDSLLLSRQASLRKLTQSLPIEEAEELEEDILLTSKWLPSVLMDDIESWKYDMNKAAHCNVATNDDVIFGRLLTWLSLLDFLDGAELVDGRNRSAICSYIKAIGVTTHILSVCADYALFQELNNEKWMHCLALENNIDETGERLTLARVATLVMFRSIRSLPTLVKSWWNEDCPRALNQEVSHFVQNQISPETLRIELERIKMASSGFGEMNVSGSCVSREVTATYIQDECKLSVIIRVPPSFPFRNAEVDCRKTLGIQEKRWRHWSLQIMMMLNSQDGSILDALKLWKENVDKEFEGVEPCPVCYSVLSVKTHAMPNLECKTCHHRFHTACLYKWFHSSGKSQCVLCQQPWSGLKVS